MSLLSVTQALFSSLSLCSRLFSYASSSLILWFISLWQARDIGPFVFTNSCLVSPWAIPSVSQAWEVLCSVLLIGNQFACMLVCKCVPTYICYVFDDIHTIDKFLALPFVAHLWVGVRTCRWSGGPCKCITLYFDYDRPMQVTIIHHTCEGRGKERKRKRETERGWAEKGGTSTILMVRVCLLLSVYSLGGLWPRGSGLINDLSSSSPLYWVDLVTSVPLIILSFLHSSLSPCIFGKKKEEEKKSFWERKKKKDHHHLACTLPVCPDTWQLAHRKCPKCERGKEKNWI